MEQAHGKAKARRSLREIKTAITGRVRSKPRAEGQKYLDLYTLKRDHARWTALKERAEQMLRAIDKALKKVDPPTQDAPGEAPDEPRPTKTIDFNTCHGRTDRI